jgi:hypothetical protein
MSKISTHFCPSLRDARPYPAVSCFTLVSEKFQYQYSDKLLLASLIIFLFNETKRDGWNIGKLEGLQLACKLS